MPKRKVSNLIILAIALMPLLFMSTQVFGQSATSLGGSVMDASQAVLPGATVKVTNSQTGVSATTTANNAGVYNFPSLQPGVYSVSAEMKGFQPVNKTDVKLGMGAQIRLNFEMVVQGVTTEISVISTSAGDLLLEQGSSTGTVLPENTVSELPLASNDVMDLINVMGGVVKAENPIFANNEQTFAGVASGNINIQRDGISINEVRYTSGIVSPSRINPEMVGEFKMILSPVDAEMGRGAGQVQILTKSGANAFHGSGVWNVQNTALDANEFYNNRVVPRVIPAWRNLNNYTLSLSGPIIKNKTFFFVTWDQQIVRSRAATTPTVLTPCARKGIYRYIGNWINGSTQQAEVLTTGSKQRKSVDSVGAPLLTYTDKNGATTTDALRYNSVFGDLTSAARAQIDADPINCSQFNFSASNQGFTTARDTYRTGYDESGYIQRFSDLMPAANTYDIGDGLNVAGHRWVRTLKGSDTVFGSGEDNQRKSIMTKIDHNFNSAHRISGTYMYETDLGEDAYATWPTGYGGAVDRQPQTFTVSLTSTLKPTLLNEFRMGLSRTRTHTNEPLNNPVTGEKMRALLMQLMDTSDATKYPNYTGYPLIIGPGAGNAGFYTDTYYTSALSTSNPYGSRGNLPATWGGVDPRWTFSDTITWTRGAHSFRGGADFRLQKSWQETNGAAGFYQSMNTFPSVQGGTFGLSAYRNGEMAGFGTEVVGTDSGGSSTGNYSGMYNLLTYMSGSVGNVRQYFYIADDKNAIRWNDPSLGELNYVTDLRNREFSFFFKDDWKVSSSLTLNLGMRYEYYGVPWVNNGQTTAIEGGNAKLFGASGGDFSTWMPANPTMLAGDQYLTNYQFVGPNSPNSGKSAWNSDYNNIAPHVGFAWQLPWFGKGKTTLRGGYSVSYSPISNFDGYAGIIAKVPGTTFTYAFSGNADHPYINLNTLGQVVPLQGLVPSNIQPLMRRPITDRSQAITVYDENIRNPYIQALNMSLTRNIGNNLTVDVRYIASLSRKQISGVNLNTANYINNGLYDALKIAREGGESALLDSMIRPSTLWFGASGASQLRTFYGTNTNMMLGDFAAVASTLATTNGIMPVASGITGAVLRNAGFSENFIYTNPQFASATINGNNNHANYHSMQAQVTMRPTRGLSFQTTYTWSRSLGMTGNTNPFDRQEDYHLVSQHRSHQLTSFGTYTLPMGANGFIFRNSTGLLKKAVEGWQLSWTSSMTSGLPGSITGANRLWGANNVDFVGPKGSWDNKAGQVTWEPGAFEGYFFGNKYTRVIDPQCSKVSSQLASLCSGSTGLKALALASDPSVIVFQNPELGKRGNFGINELAGPGRWSLDMAIGKAIEFMEGKTIDFRVDAQNIFNHPTPSGGSPYAWNARFTQIYNPQFGLNSTEAFGRVGSKGGHRTWQAKVRIGF